MQILSFLLRDTCEKKKTKLQMKKELLSRQKSFHDDCITNRFLTYHDRMLSVAGLKMSLVVAKARSGLHHTH